jgi:hypothetical protein
MSPIEAATAAFSWSGRWLAVVRCFILRLLHLRKVVATVTAISVLASLFLGTWSLGAGAWRAAGGPVLATEAYVDNRMEPIVSAMAVLNVSTIESRIEGLETRKALIAGELFKFKQIDLGTIKDATARAAIEGKIIDLSTDAARIQNKLDDLQKLQHKIP